MIIGLAKQVCLYGTESQEGKIAGSLEPVGIGWSCYPQAARKENPEKGEQL